MFDNGCEWIRCDFHLHTRKDKEFKYIGEDNSFINDYADKLENENTCCKFDLDTLLVELEKLNKDYFIVFAYIAQRSRLIEECGGSRLTSLAQNHEFKKRVLGLQKLRTFDNKEKIKNWFGYEIAFVEDPDPKKIEEIEKGQLCYVKIEEYTFNSLKFSLQDYKNRISNEKKKINHGYINSILFKGGKLDSIKILFSNELNILIGIRGSGKS